ncbi:2-amino-4-hydroxy-6-hydroxymethyldihydropteridine diphosphokinase [Arthrobacter sp. TmT3-37]|jgi:2-amino-4-hydroxy-6-hydroxymethyldihydropteridine diphosphokinase|uniref:2-amino-4-hydroxy-6-hydroxymethyldihydropteridine diphosphokinase n=1 Tax=Arthrobacter agilis TaxID=37921 RepID=A0A2L0UAW9_9MICC|nr:2-amino-4-hydroxy-6-hydroxymethyldihydropteridine diphosphokinase [Arthrobacter agilis]AUZ86352.1 2-amino-4-hydroxy-6-hydroxymethyldihydropteridine diphosphokinase [Arthrobacter agilis]
MSTVRSVLALGSNLGASSDTLVRAVADLVDSEHVRLRAVSPVVRTKPVGGPEQPDYLNMVIEVETDLGPYELLAHCQSVEDVHHRKRTVRWGPRTLDVDIITYGAWTSDDDALTIPHPRAASRAFVLQPWAWMDPGAELGGRPVAGLAAEAADLAGLVPFEGV